jgi:hypothetical protein
MEPNIFHFGSGSEEPQIRIVAVAPDSFLRDLEITFSDLSNEIKIARIYKPSSGTMIFIHFSRLYWYSAASIGTQPPLLVHLAASIGTEV